MNLAERNRLIIQRMSPMEKEKYFKSLLSKILEEKPLYTNFISRFVDLKYNLGLDTQFSEMMTVLKENDLRPDCRFFATFIHKSCEKGDMDETSMYLKSMHQMGIMPSEYIFANILHGYVKCGLPDEVAATQDVMSSLNFWPSMSATEHMLTAYADLGDGAALIETMQESKAILQSNENEALFSDRLVAELYARLSMAPNFASNQSASKYLLEILKQREPRGEDFSIGFHLSNLFSSRHTEAAMNMIEAIKPHNLSPRFIANIGEYIVRDDQDLPTLTKFWNISGDMDRVPDFALFMSTKNLLLTLKCYPSENLSTLWRLTNFAVQRAFNDKNINDLLEIGEIVFQRRQFLYYMSVVPRILSLGMKPTDLVSAFEDPAMKSASSLGCVLSELCPISAFMQIANASTEGQKFPDWSIESARHLLNEFTSAGHLPYEGFLPINPRNMRSFLTGAALHSANGIISETSPIEICQTKFNDWADILFACYPENRQFLLSGGLSDQLENFMHESQKSRIFESEKLLKRSGRSLSNALKCYIASKNINFGSDWRNSKGVEFQKGSHSATSTFDTVTAALKSGDIEAAIEAIEKMKTAGVDLTLRLGTVIRRGRDLLDEAFDVNANPVSIDGISDVEVAHSSTKNKEATYSNAQLEKLFWILFDANFLRHINSSVSKLANLYVKSSDFNGLNSYLLKMLEVQPGCISRILSINFLSSLLQVNGDETEKLVKTVCANTAINLPSMTYILYNYQVALQSNSKKSEKGVTTSTNFDLGVSTLASRLEGMTHMRKVRAMHDAIEDLCHSRRILPAYTLRDWAVQLGLVLLVQTSEVLIASSVFMDDHIPISESQLNIERLSLHKNPELGFLSKIYENAKWPTERLDQAVKNCAQILFDQPFINGSINYSDTRMKTTQFMLWSLVIQALQNPDSTLSSNRAWRRLASELINDKSFGVDACLSWISCLLDRKRIASIMVAGLASEKSSSKFIEHLQKNPSLTYEIVVTSLYDDLDSSQKATLSKSLNVLGHQELLNLVHALIKTTNSHPQDIMNGFKTDLESSLSNLINADFSLMMPIIEALEETPLDKQICLLNRVLDCTQTRKVPTSDIFSVLNTMSLPDLRVGEKNWLSLKNRVSDENQIYLHALFKFLKIPREYSIGWSSVTKLIDNINFTYGISSDKVMQAIRQNKQNVLIDALLGIHESNPSNLQFASNAIIQSLILENQSQNLIPFLFSACNLRNPDLLEAIAKSSSPFLHNNFSGSFLGLVDIFRQLPLDHVTYESINFHKLSKYFVAPGRSRTVNPISSLSRQPDTLVDDTHIDQMKLSKESIPVLVSKFSGDQLSDDVSKSLIEMLRKLWGPGRVDIVLCHLVEMHDVKAVDRIVDNMAQELKERRLPFKAITRIIHHHSQPTPADPSLYVTALESLRACEPQNLALCMTGPHISRLFSTWPENTLHDALELVELTTGRIKTILKLQLAASLLHRNLLDKAASLLKESGPLPFNYLAGTLQHPLKKSSLLASVNYIRNSDESHLPSLIDAALRNAAISARNKNAFTVNELVHTTVNDLGFNLNSVCQPTTLRLLNEVAKDDLEFLKLLTQS